MSNYGRTANVYTDGACINQGISNPKAGYGVYWGEAHPNNRSGPIAGLQESNRAELFAARQAIETAASQGYSGITIHSDSQYVRDAIARSALYQNSSDANRDLLQSIEAYKSRVNVGVQYIQSGAAGNWQADQLASAAAKQ